MTWTTILAVVWGAGVAAVAYAKSGGLLPAIIGHAAWSSTAVAMRLVYRS